MVKLEVRIGIRGSHSAVKEVTPNFHESVNWLMDAFEISHRRAKDLFKVMEEEANSSSSGYAVVVLDYRQLARYTAKRQVEGLNHYWKYPHVLSHEVETPEYSTVVELRRGKRKTSLFGG